jgi:hypothetical protein
VFGTPLLMALALPAGIPVGTVMRPPSAAEPYCSSTRPVCVHDRGSRPAEALTALAALEDAYERVVYGLGLPPPLADAGLGGSDALDAYLVEPGEALRIEPDPPESGSFARAAGS